jgi:hypothetical protein
MHWQKLYTSCFRTWANLKAYINWEYRRGKLAALEQYFARSLGFALLALALTVIVLSGAVPLGSSSESEKNHPPPSPLHPSFLTSFSNLARAFYGLQ